MKLALIGYGQMGQALAERWFALPEISEFLLIKRGFADVKPAGLPAHVQCQPDIGYLVTWSADVVLLAVKPQQMGEVLAELQPLIKPQTLIVTVAAALPLAFYEQGLYAEQPVIRVMPNTPSQVGQGMNVGIANSNVQAEQQRLIETLFAQVGQWAWLADEAQIATAAAISGSGPAYYFLLTELLAQWGKQQGLDTKLAEQLARQTMVGSGALLADRNGQSPTELRAAVTSKGGVTAAALQVFQQKNALLKLVTEALDANIARGAEMARGS